MSYTSVYKPETCKAKTENKSFLAKFVSLKLGGNCNQSLQVAQQTTSAWKLLCLFVIFFMNVNIQLDIS